MPENIATTLDGILNCRLMVEQPKEGFRIAVDTILLAAAVPATSGQRVIDLGCGVGGAMLALGSRIAGLQIDGLELQSELVELCTRNIKRNTLPSLLNVTQGDVSALPSEWHAKFDHAMMNPPYHDTARHDISPNSLRRIANAEGEARPEIWIAAAHRALKPDGRLTIIHRADRAKELIQIVSRYFDSIHIKPIISKAGQAAKRVVICAGLQASGALITTEPLIMHEPNGCYTAVAEAILRDGAALI